MMKAISVMLWLLAVAGSLVGGVMLAFGILASTGAPQEAAAAAMGAAAAVTPYVLARAWDEIRKPEI